MQGPEGVAHDQERDVDLVGVAEDVVAGRLDHLAVGYDDFAAIEGFLLPCNLATRLHAAWATTHQHVLFDEQHGRVGFEVDARRLLDDFQALDRDVALVGETQTYKV